MLVVAFLESQAVTRIFNSKENKPRRREVREGKREEFNTDIDPVFFAAVFASSRLRGYVFPLGLPTRPSSGILPGLLNS